MSARYNPFNDNAVKASADRVSTNRFLLPNEARAFINSALDLVRASGSNQELSTTQKFDQQRAGLMASLLAPTLEASTPGLK